MILIDTKQLMDTTGTNYVNILFTYIYVNISNNLSYKFKWLNSQ